MKKILGLTAVALLASVSFAPAQDILIQDWDAASEGAVGVTFQNAGFSGSTGANIEAGSTSLVVDTDAVSAPHSLELGWSWSGAAPADAKVRITTFNAATTGSVANPIIDFERALGMQVKITEGTLDILGVLVRDNGNTPPGGAGTAAGDIIRADQPLSLDAAVDTDWVKYSLDFTTATYAAFTGTARTEPNATTGALDALYVERTGAAASVTILLDDLQIEDPSATNIENWSVY